MLMYQTDVGTVEDESILNPPATSPSEKISSFLPANKRKLNRHFYRINYIMAYPKKLIRITYYAYFGNHKIELMNLCTLFMNFMLFQA